MRHCRPGAVPIARCYARPVLRRLLAALVLAGAVSGPAGLLVDLTPDVVQRAIDQARTATPASRAAFHAPYMRRFEAPPVRRLSLVSEYRRVVLATEERLRLGDRLFGVRQGTEVVAPWRGGLEVIAELQFHPQHLLLTVPPYDILLWPEPAGAERAPMVPLSTDRVPSWGTPVEPAGPDDWGGWWPFPVSPGVSGGGTQPLSGAWIRARFDARALPADARVTVLVKQATRTLATATFDLARLP